MQPQAGKRKKTVPTRVLYLSGVIFLLLLLSVLIVACGGTNTTDLTAPSFNSSAVTTTIHLGNNTNVTPPPLPPYSCAAWATETTPAINMTTVVGVYAKFIHNVSGNPEGVAGATATAVVSWGTAAGESMPVQPVNPTTGTDGLASFKVDLTNLTTVLNKVILVQVTFTKDGVQSCTTSSSPAYFTLVMVSPTADNGTPTDINGTPIDNGNNGNGNGGGKKKHHG